METGRKAKRLRGWQRQKVEAEVAAGEAASPDPWETGLGSDPCEKDQESAPRAVVQGLGVSYDGS